MAAGDFTASHLPDILVARDQVFKGERHSRGILKDVSIAQAFLERQKVDWKVFYDQAGLNNKRKCIGAKVAWLKSCNDEVTDCSEDPITSCDITGPEMESDNQMYSPNICYSKSMAVADNQCKDMFDKATKIGVAMATIMASLEQEFQKRIIAFLLGNGQQNRYTNPIWTVDGDTTKVPPEYWNEELLADIVAAGELNDIYDQYLVTGSNFWKANFLSRYKENCCRTDSLVTERGPIDMYFDLRNVDQANGGIPTTFLVDSGAYGYFNVTEYQNESPIPFSQGSDLSIMRIPSQRLRYNNGNTLEPVYFDFQIQEKCTVSNGDMFVNTVIKGYHNGGLALAPVTCNENDTGILIFENVGDSNNESE